MTKFTGSDIDLPALRGAYQVVENAIENDELLAFLDDIGNLYCTHPHAEWCRLDGEMWVVTFGGKVLRRRALSLPEVRGIHARSLSCAEAYSQRAALAGALEPFEKLARAVEHVPLARFGTVYEFGGVAITVPDLARVIAALALVRGEVSDG